jgi:hypothetical protein
MGQPPAESKITLCIAVIFRQQRPNNGGRVRGAGGVAPRTVIDFGGGNTLTITNFLLSNLAASDFSFV